MERLRTSVPDSLPMGSLAPQTIKIGFGYKARRGKDTACRALVAAFGYLDVKQYAFADQLRAEVASAILDRWVQDRPNDCFDPTSPEPMRHLCAWAGVPFDPEAPVSDDYCYGKQRALYQWWGTEYRRRQDPQYWVKALAKRIEQERPRWAVISDLRFYNEFKFCDYRVRMDRPGFEIGDGAHHESEIQLDFLPAFQWDAVIRATTPEEVEAAARCVFRGLIARRYGVRREELSAFAADPLTR